MTLKIIDSLIMLNGSSVNANLTRSIQGHVFELGRALPCRVRLFEKVSGRLIRETVSTETGFYKFENLDLKNYFIVAHHPASQFNAVIQDNVVPK